ncbi:MAG: hypothetical protein Sv326_1342 (plasmid) [Candidatus Fermentimicrarchaeum limneticum]|uniref:Uncharacterized protein n=1 Tax=Fermentimicrarchaeum limneticum TaxID=2795018 RepID=A0A7D6BB50_FERL1|nr:MAG: hypothetical protein Sv326_1342 [Candidatus Fermentimicrarchaeum limneticum]
MKTEKFDLIIGKNTEYRFGLRYSKRSGDLLLKFLNGNMLCLYKKDVKEMLDYLTKIYGEMR